ncbi:MAG TPA: multidrug effflux MFS transporter [Chryseosolibacter sp.]|nr:multidrug effflux MFS transporter [Chryseosolibacter sp.]
MTRRQHFTLILILGALSTLSPFSIDMYLPGFPAIASDLDTTIDVVQLSLTSYFIGIAAGQLLYGPLLDRFGRKRPLYAGLGIYVIASFGCALIHSADALIFMRFIQAVGGCAGMVAAQALVRDLFPIEKIAQAFSWITLVIAISPMIAPAVGSYVAVAFGWQAIFVILASLALMLIVGIYFALPAGKGPDSSLSLLPKPVMKNFVTVIKQPQFLLYTLAGGIATSAPFAYIAGSADVFMNFYGVNEKEYGFIFAFIAFFIIGSTQLNHFLLRRFTSSQIIRTTLIYQTILAVVLIGGAWLFSIGKYELIGLTALFLGGQGLTNPNANALALAPFSKHVGSAASLAGAFRMGMGGFVSALVSVFHNGTAMPMIGVMTGCVIVGFAVLIAGRSLGRSTVGESGLNGDKDAVAI